MTWEPATLIFDRLYTLERPTEASRKGATALLEPEAPPVPSGPPHEAETYSPLLCYCFGVTEQQATEAILAYELKTPEALRERTRAGGGCGSCRPDAEDLLAALWQEVAADGYVVVCHRYGATPGGVSAPTEGDALAGLSALDKIRKVTAVLNTHIRPLIQGDGGDIHLIDIDGNRVIVSLQGACDTCPSSTMTLHGLVQERLRHFVSPDLEVIAL